MDDGAGGGTGDGAGDGTGASDGAGDGASDGIGAGVPNWLGDTTGGEAAGGINRWAVDSTVFCKVPSSDVSNCSDMNTLIYEIMCCYRLF